MGIEDSGYSRRVFLRRTGLVIGGAALLPLLEACGVTSQSGAPSASGQASASVPATPVVTPAPGQKVVQFWSGADPVVKALLETDLIPAFEKANPDIKILANVYTFPEFFQKIQIALAGGIGPDVIGSGFGQLGSLIGSNALQPIDDVVNAWDDVSDILPLGIDSGKKDGKRYGLLMANAYAFNYRTDMYEAAGLDPTKPPTTWNEVEDYAKKLTLVEGGAVKQAGIDIPVKNGEQVFAAFAFTHGLKNLWDESGQALYTASEAVETLEFLVKLVNEDKVTVPSDSQAATGTAFSSGVAAQGFSQSQLYADIEKLAPGKLGAAKPPSNGGNQSLLLGTFYGLTAAARDPESSAKFLQFLYSKDSVWAHYEKAGFVPLRQSLSQQFVDAKPYNKVLSEIAQQGTGWPIFPTFLQARATLNTHLEAIYLGQQSAADGLKQAADETAKLK